MEAHEMKKIERRIKYLAEHMDEYTYEEYLQACQETADEAYKIIFDVLFLQKTVEHLRHLQSLYRFIKLGMYS